jgi:hypothetical protein
MMKNETTVTKLTAAQAYALQVKADKRARVLEERANPELKADRQRVDAMFSTVVNKRSTKVAKAKKVSNRVAWTQPEVDFLVQQYTDSVDLVNLTYNRGDIETKFEQLFGSQHVNSVHLILCQIKHIDAYYPAQGMTSVSQLVRERAYAADPVRFSDAVKSEEEALNALDLLLAEIRG